MRINVLPREATSSYEELLLLFKHGLPDNIRNRWHKSPNDLEGMLSKGGFVGLPPKFVTKALKSNQDNGFFFGRNTYQNKVWYCFDDDNREYDTPKVQVAALKAASTDEEKKKVVPEVPDNFFRQYVFSHLKDYIQNDTNDPNSPDNPASPANESTNDANNNAPTTTGDTNSNTPILCLPTNSKIDYASKFPKLPPRHVTPASGRKYSHVPIKKKDDSSTMSTGIVLVDIDRYDKFQREVVEKHARSCPAGSLEVIRQVKEGYELDRQYHCKFCKKTYKMSTGPEEDPNAPRKRGRNARPINTMMSVASFNSGAPAAQVRELFADAGIVCPGKNGQRKMQERTLEATKSLSEAQMKENRINHNKALQKMDNYKGDVVFTDTSGKKHSFTVGQVALDGNGAKRSYGHIVTGEEHATVVVSLVTGEVLYVWHDQISCYGCQRKLTELLNSESNTKRAMDLNAQDLSHPGRCYVNSQHNPASAEEWACESLAEFLLIDPETGDFRSDEEAILCECIIGDGDTKGPNKFINKQAELVPTYHGKAEYIPDIGHFIKCISNAFYALAAKNGELRGKSLLEAPRIRCMCGDISKYLREYGMQYRDLSQSAAPDAACTLEKLRDQTLARIDAMVDHHCGDHSKCNTKDCLYLRLQNHHYAKYCTEHEDDVKEKKLTYKQIIVLCEDKINEDYARQSRFKGMTMSISNNGRAKIRKEITKRLDKKNIDRVALAMSSNGCENFFSRVIKFTSGKRIYFGRKDGWEIRVKFAAAKKSDPRMTNKVRNELGIKSTSAVREMATVTMLREQEYHAQYKKQDKYKERRKAKKLITSKVVMKNSKDPARHKTEKLSAKAVVKSKAKSSVDKPSVPQKRKTNCPNCKHMHPGKCPEPVYNAKRKKIKSKLVDESYISSLFGS